MRELGPEKSKRPNCFELFPATGSEVIKACKVDGDGKVVEGESWAAALVVAGVD